MAVLALALDKDLAYEFVAGHCKDLLEGWRKLAFGVFCESDEGRQIGDVEDCEVNAEISNA